jgi:hypothetical protein
MEENRFFKFVGWFNGVAFMVLGVLVIGILGIAGFKILYHDLTRKRTFIDTVILAENNRIDEKWQLGHLRKIAGSPYLMIPLFVEQSYAKTFCGKSSQSTRNLLFINTINNEKRWLLDRDDYLILRDELLSENEYDRESKPIRAILYIVVKKDTNGDKRLTSDDKIVVALSTPSGHGYKEILNEIDVFIDYQMLNKDKMLIIYQKQGVQYSATFALADFKGQEGPVAGSNQVRATIDPGEALVFTACADRRRAAAGFPVL